MSEAAQLLCEHVWSYVAEHRQHMRRCYAMDGRLLATDGTLLVWWPLGDDVVAEFLTDPNDFSAGPRRVLAVAEAVAKDVLVIDRARLAEWSGDVGGDCDNCYGGHVSVECYECDHQHDCRCNKCEGIGKIITVVKGVLAGAAVDRRKIARVLAALPPSDVIEIARPPGPHHPFLFRVPGIDAGALLAPLSPSTLNDEGLETFALVPPPTAAPDEARRLANDAAEAEERAAVAQLNEARGRFSRSQANDRLRAARAALAELRKAAP